MLTLLSMLTLAFSALIFFGPTPYTVYAESGYTIGESIVPCVQGECSVCDLQQLAMRIMGFFVVMVVIVAALLFTNAGVLYVFSPANPANIARAHKIFNTLIGLVIVLASYMIIDVVMKSLYASKDTGWGPWNALLCEEPNSSGTQATTETGGAMASGIRLSDAEARDGLAQLGVNVKKTNTSLQGLRQDTYNGFVAMVKDAGQNGVAPENFVVTGGTETTGGHVVKGRSHTAGWKLDLRNGNKSVDTYITNTFADGGVRSGDGAQLYVKTYNDIQVTCAAETTHWDCLYVPVEFIQ